MQWTFSSLTQSWTVVGSVRGLFRVASRVFPQLVGRVRSGPIVWVCVGHPGWYRIFR